MEWFALFLSVSIIFLIYQIFKIVSISKKHKLEQQRREYAFARRLELDERYQNYTHNINRKIKNLNYNKKTNIFREMAIDAIANQSLVYDSKSGKYVRTKRTN